MGKKVLPHILRAWEKGLPVGGFSKDKWAARGLAKLQFVQRGSLERGSGEGGDGALLLANGAPKLL